MKKIGLSLIGILLAFGMNAQNISGAWEHLSTSEDGDPLINVMIFVDGYYASTTYHATIGKFIKTHGGSWKLENNLMIENLEFDTNNSERVGTEVNYKVNVSENELEIVDSHLKFTRVDSGQPGALHGAWLMSGRTIDGNSQIRNTDGPRKTMKILSGMRFQWIAYNTETKQFMGTGGGTYTTIDGDYTETIEFFSRDDSRVGISLKFNYELIDGNWHHTGLSSKGDPINEIWSLRK